MTILIYLIWETKIRPIWMIVFGFLLLVPGGIDGTTQLFGERESTNVLRLLTGLLLGIGVVLIINGIYNFIINNIIY